MNQYLKQLYQETWSDLEDQARETDNVTHPLLVKVNECVYKNADVKVMIFGQETDGWYGDYPREEIPFSIDELMEGYSEYFYTSKNKSLRPFWNRNNFSFFQQGLEKFFNDKNKTTAFVWNNISKIGKVNRGKATKSIRNMELSHFQVIEKEVEILKPDIIIFTTGHTRDSYIQKAFGKDNVEFEYAKFSFSSMDNSYQDGNMMAKINLSNYPSICAIRVEHPNRRTLSNELILQVIKDTWEGANHSKN